MRLHKNRVKKNQQKAKAESKNKNRPQAATSAAQAAATANVFSILRMNGTKSSHALTTRSLSLAVALKLTLISSLCCALTLLAGSHSLSLSVAWRHRRCWRHFFDNFVDDAAQDPHTHAHTHPQRIALNTNVNECCGQQRQQQQQAGWQANPHMPPYGNRQQQRWHFSIHILIKFYFFSKCSENKWINKRKCKRQAGRQAGCGRGKGGVGFSQLQQLSHHTTNIKNNK